MAEDDRAKLLNKIEALLAKTVANGCTPGEAAAALEKAREFMQRFKQLYEEAEAEPEPVQAADGGHYYDSRAVLREIEEEIASWIEALEQASQRRWEVEDELTPVMDRIDELNRLIRACYCRDKHGVLGPGGEWQMVQSEIMVAHWRTVESEFRVYAPIERLVLKIDGAMAARRHVLFAEQVAVLEGNGDAFKEWHAAKADIGEALRRLAKLHLRQQGLRQRREREPMREFTDVGI